VSEKSGQLVRVAFGKEVLQYTLDLRKPNLRKNLDLRKIVGATNFLVHKLFDLRKIF
jgi:hypothetical protein